MRKNLVLPLLLSLVMVLTAPVFAEEAESTVAPTRRIHEIREEIKEKRQELKQELKDKKQNLIQNLKDKVGKALTLAGRITGELTAISGNTLTVKSNKDGKSYQVNVNSKTQLVRRFGGKSTLSEFTVGNIVNVVGKWVDDTKNAIDAKLVRNTSVQKRFGAFLGEVTQINSDNLVIKTVNRNEQTVYFTGAKFVDRAEKTMDFGQIKVGDRIRVKGMWDRSTNKITEVNQIKDFSYPQKPAVTPEK